jgi:hypothetical protein
LKKKNQKLSLSWDPAPLRRALSGLGRSFELFFYTVAEKFPEAITL